MTIHDFDFDPDDNFANGLPAGRDELDDDATAEALVWQLLLLVNPGDEDAALQQFTAYQDALADDEDSLEPVWRIRDAIDWKAGCHCRTGRTLEPAHRLGRRGSDRRRLPRVDRRGVARRAGLRSAA